MSNRLIVLVTLLLSSCGGDSSSGDSDSGLDTGDSGQIDMSADVGADAPLEVDLETDHATSDAGADLGTDSTTETPCNESYPDHTVGLLTCLPEAYEGYTLFAPISATTAYLIDVLGRVVHFWNIQYSPGNVVYLLENGNLLVTGQYSPNPNPRLHSGGEGGVVQEYDWDGDVVWHFEYSTQDHRQHHDVEMLPNGNVLMVAWEYKSTAQAVGEGREPARARGGLWPDTIIEVEPIRPEGGEIVWEWHAWDHVIQDFDSDRPNFGIVADHPELIDLNFASQPSPDWLHINAVAYNTTLDQIALSVHNSGEVWIIDHSTTTAQAASHEGGDSGMGGDLLFRWGNPQTYDAGSHEDQWLFGQHDSHWIPDGYDGAGNILIFDNGMGRGDAEFSRIVEITPPLLPDGSYDLTSGSAYEPADPAWVYTDDPPSKFYSQNISGSQRLPNGNTLICSGATGRFFEVTADGDIVWEYVSPATGRGFLAQGEQPGEGPGRNNSVFRAYRYDADFPGLAGRDLTTGDVLER